MFVLALTVWVGMQGVGIAQAPAPGPVIVLETSKGTIECFMGTASYWAPERDPALQWFMSIPFGMDPQGMASWYYQADGRKLMEETYAPYNVVPRLGPAFAPQMGAGSRRR
jgi:TRAP-type mannitol/chloroaromatic compound transport system substrate-binding protein